MELFLKIFAAKAFIAKSVSVFFPASADIGAVLPYGLPLERILRAANADEFWWGENHIELEGLYQLRKTKPRGKNYLVASDLHLAQSKKIHKTRTS